ncbi:MAG: cupin domain-containing protein [Nitrospirota bacterium]|jgi:mannose-6-phosphate isomerase-like protein (cupin superfamily)
MARWPFLLLLSLAACATPQPAPQVPTAGWFSHYSGGRAERLRLDLLLDKPRFARPDNIIPITLAIGAHSSHHLVQVRRAEPPHLHATHDLTVRVVRGDGRMHLGDRSFPVTEGDTTFIPRGVAHYFENTGATPAALLAIFSPAFDGRDRVPVGAPPAPGGKTAPQ